MTKVVVVNLYNTLINNLKEYKNVNNKRNIVYLFGE